MRSVIIKKLIIILALITYAFLIYYWVDTKILSRVDNLENIDVSREYIKARKLFRRGEIKESIGLLKKVLKNKKRPEDIPRSEYLLAQSYRHLAENFREVKSEDADQTLSVDAFTLSATYFQQAINYYKAVYQGYPSHFLADDSFRWVAGCEFRMGKYLDSFMHYLDLKEYYPDGDQAKKVNDDVKMCFAVIMDRWQKLSQIDRARFFKELNRTIATKIKWDFPNDAWKKFNKIEAGEFVAILQKQNKVPEFLQNSGFFDQLTFTQPLSSSAESWSIEYIKYAFYNGDFFRAFRVAQIVWPKLNDKGHQQVETYYWMSSLLAVGLKDTLELCLKEKFHNGLITLAYGFLDTEDLKDFIYENRKDMMDETSDSLEYILAMKYYSAEDFSLALDVFLKLANTSETKLKEEAIQRVLEIEYFFDIPQDLFKGVSNYDAFHGFLGSSNFSEDLKRLEVSIWGSEFITKERDLLNDIYKEYSIYESLIWGKHTNRIDFIGTNELKKKFLKFVISSVARIKNSSHYKSVPSTTKVALEGLLDVVINPEKYDFDGTRDHFSREKIIFKRCITPYVKDKQAFSKETIKKEVLPLLTIIWNLTHIGELPTLEDDQNAYFDYQRGVFLIGQETFFKNKEAITLYESSWDPNVVNLGLNHFKLKKSLFLFGYNYLLAGEYFKKAAKQAKTPDLLKKSIFMSAVSNQLYSRSLRSLQLHWKEAIYTLVDYVDPESLSDIGQYRTIKAFKDSHIFIPFSDEWHQAVNEAIAEYTLFIQNFPSDVLTDDAYYNMGLLCEASDNKNQASVAFAKARELNGDIAKKIELDRVLGVDNYMPDQEAITVKMWVAFFLHKYNDLDTEYQSYLNQHMFEDFSKNSKTYYLLGMSHYRLGRFDQALKYFITYLKQENDGAYIPQILDILPQLTNNYDELLPILDAYIENQENWINLSFYMITKARILEKMNYLKAANDIYHALSVKKNLIKNDKLLDYLLARSSSNISNRTNALRKLDESTEWFVIINGKLESLKILANQFLKKESGKK